MNKSLSAKPSPRSGVRVALFCILGGLSPALPSFADSLFFSGNNLKVISVEPESSTGLEEIYVAYSLQGVSASFASPSAVKWSKFTNLGGAYAEELTDIRREGDRWVLPQVEADTGYIVETSDGRQHCFWVVEYAPYRLSLRSASAASEKDCDASLIDVDGSGQAIHYFTVLGQQKTLSRDITVNYNSLQWNEAESQFDALPLTMTFEYLHPQLRIYPPALCQTDFVISGDRFLREWNWEQSVSTGVVSPSAVEVHTSALQASANESSPSNVIKTGEGDILGGSAPVDIAFRAWVSDGVVHNEWQMSRDPGFGAVEYRFNQQDLDFTFQDEGTWFVRFIGSDNDGSCSAYGDIYSVVIGGSELRIPNAFSPNGDGVNDEWKVAYRSLLEFECWIFDRYGNQIFHFTDPNSGWDGKRGGKIVPPGVYYYVITARGADGKKYKESGDINIIRSVDSRQGNEN